MNFYLAKSFTRALQDLNKQDAAQAKRAALDFQIDPSQPGFKFHRIQNARDRNMWSFRVNRDVRAIVHHKGDTFILCYVDHHDDAYTWAERHKVEEHPTTGQTQIVEVVERQEVITRTVYEDQTVVLPPLAEAPVALLLAIGVPTDWVDWVRHAEEDALVEHLDRFPEDVQERLLDLLTGGTASPPPAVAPHTAPAASRDIVPIDDADELTRILDSPWEQWLVFLHPEQRAVVDRSYSGAARVYGSAGTGKTIVALHRVKWLLEEVDEDAPVLFTTYTNELTRNLVERLELLVGDELDDEYPHLHVTNFHRWLTNWHRRQYGAMELATEADVERMIEKALVEHADTGFDAAFILSEWNAIIDPYYVRDRAHYFRISRTGRGRALGKRQKAQLWKIFESVQQQLQRTHKRTLYEYSGLAAAYFNEHPRERPFRHSVVDEAQDFAPVELQALRAITIEGADDLFLCADAGQRLYGRAFSWLQNGVDIRGRSMQLAINYRTTEQIRAACEALLPRQLAGPAETTEARVAKSLRRGEAITLEACETSGEQVTALARWIKHCVEQRGIALENIAVLARTPRIAMRVGSTAARQLDYDYSQFDGGGYQRRGLAIGDMKTAKGLEFRAVAIVEVDADTVPLAEALEKARADEGDIYDVLEMERNLLYVAGTRARDSLFISYVGEPSQFLSLLISPEEPAVDEPGDHPDEQTAEETQTAPAAPAPPVAPPLAPPDPRVAQSPARAHVTESSLEDVASRAEVEVVSGRTRQADRAQFKISPSRIATFFGLDCERYLRFSSAWNEARIVADAVPEPEETRDYARAILDSGFAWEEEVITARLRSEQLLVADGDGPITDRYFKFEQAREVLSAATPGQFIYELTLIAPPAFYARFGIDPNHVEVSQCRPDLIEVRAGDEPGTRSLRIIDMKRSSSVHATHHIQLYMYALLLDAVVRDLELEGITVDIEEGAIWLGGDDAPTPCLLDGVRPHVEEFLRTQLHSIFTSHRSDVQWHVHTRCEWCPYLEHCTREMNTIDDLSRLPRMSHQGKRHLIEHGIKTVHEVREVFEDPQLIEEVIDSSATLATQRYLMEARAESLDDDRVVAQGFMARGLTIPTETELCIFLTLQRESVGRHVYALGYEIVMGEGVPERVVRRSSDDHGAVLVAQRVEDVAHIRRQFVVELYGLLSRVDAYNLGQQWRDRLSVQFFVYSRTEEQLLGELLFEAMRDAETSRAARTLLMFFQGPDLILTSEHPEQNVPLPVAVLLDMVGRVAALPIPVTYTLPEILTALGAPDAYPRDPEFHHPFAAYLRADAIFEAWYRDKPERVAELSAHIASFLEASSLLFTKLREFASDDLSMYMPKFELPLSARIRDPFLSRLAFFAQYEAAVKCRQVRDARMIARRAISTSDNVHAVTAIGDDSFQLERATDGKLDAHPLKTYLLVRDTPRGRSAQIQYNDFYHRNSFWGGGKPHADVAVVKIKAVTPDEDGVINTIACSFTRKLASELQRGDAFLLYERFSNMLMDRNITALEALEPLGDRDMLRRTLLHPELLGDEPIDVDVDTDALGLTESQTRALEHLTRRRVLALWGPPGTGKTHFLATMILAMMEAHRLAGRPFRVMINAFTHAACENVLAKIVSRQAEAGIYGGELAIAKGGDWKGEARPGAIKCREKKKIAAWFANVEQCVIGGTAWAFDKLLYADPAFIGADLVVMDEASQIKVPEAAIGMNLVHDSGRIVLAGDHLQLPPIVIGRYPEPAPGELALHRSIFEAVCEVNGGDFMVQLEENFRMNDVLTSASARLLYGERYRCGTPELAAQRLDYRPTADASEFTRSVLDPDAPLVVVLLHGLAPAKDNDLEASLIAELTVELRGGLRANSGARYDDDGEFFEHGVFIVSPHHSQIRRIRGHLQERRSWEAEPFVDTVDKMQGQEAQAVLVSYGVSDPEFAMREAEFIYSRNRLNVSVTRGKHKTVLCLPATLLDAPPKVIENTEAAAGLGYMRGLVELVRSSCEPTMFLRGRHQIEVLTLTTT